MSILDDKSLVDAIDGGIVTGLPTSPDRYAKDSPIQAASVDLHIGNVYIPGQAGDADGSAERPKRLHTLESGQTAIVSTKEELNLPSELAAIGFPLSRVSSKGLLMTNPGHVDPGFRGPLRFTVINMGKTSYVLKKGDPIVTLLFLRLSQACTKNWMQRNGRNARLPTQDETDRLSADFLDIQAGAERIAKKVVTEAGIALHKFAVVGTVVLALVSLLSGFLGPLFFGIQDLKERVAGIESSLDISKIQTQLDELNTRMDDIENR